MTKGELEHLYKILWDDLPLCGCGNPYAGFTLVRDLLNLAPFYERTHTEIAGWIGNNEGAYYLVLGMLDEAGLTEHGSNIDGSWLTTKGKWCLQAMEALEDFDALGEVGFPHDGDDCTDACWLVAS